MGAFYVYFMASLPMLHFGSQAPFSTQQFLQMCRGLIPQADIDILKESLNPERDFSYQGPLEVLKKWCAFNIALNNEIVKIRAARKHIEPVKYLRPVEYSSVDVFHIATTSHRNPSLLEGQGMLDQARWNYLEELTCGHYFDLEALIIYFQKLLILERWQRINTANKPELMKIVLT